MTRKVTKREERLVHLFAQYQQDVKELKLRHAKEARQIEDEWQRAFRLMQNWQVPSEESA